MDGGEDQYLYSSTLVIPQSHEKRENRTNHLNWFSSEQNYTKAKPANLNWYEFISSFSLALINGHSLRKLVSYKYMDKISSRIFIIYLCENEIYICKYMLSDVVNFYWKTNGGNGRGAIYMKK